MESAAVTFLSGAKASGVDFSSSLMIGRQLLFPFPATLRRVFSTHGIERDAEEFLDKSAYGEPFFAALGAKQVESMDASDYEDSTIIHDMNMPVPDGLRERFTMVYDGGTLEHVFNIPQAFKNCMEMVAPGGHFVQVNAANNYMGHGFWQFSPELIYRVFSPANGFRVEVVLLHEVGPGGPWYLVQDPEVVRARVELSNSWSTYILTIARRESVKEIFSTPPQQSDYSSLWEGEEDAESRERRLNTPYKLPMTWSRRYVPHPVRRMMKGIVRPPYLARSYRRIAEDDVLRGRWA
jgi:hypothetical protein